MTNKARKVIEKIESEGHIMIVGSDKGRVLAGQVKEKKPKRILEIGTYVGYSAILMAEASGTNTKIVTIELIPENAEIAGENIKSAGYSARGEISPRRGGEDKVEIKVGDAKKLIPALIGSFDFVFIDAAKENYLDYLQLAEEKLEKGAVVVADNVKIFERHMRDYLGYVRKSGKYKSKTYDVGTDALEVSVKR